MSAVSGAAPVATGPVAPGPVRLGLTLGYVAGASGLGLGAGGIVLGSVASDLGVAEASTAWLLAAFSVGLGVAAALGGRLVDVVGLRTTLRLACLAAVIGAVGVIVAPNLPALVVARLFVGAGSGAISIVAFAVASGALHDRARTSGVLTGTSVMIIGTGPLVGALAESAAGWRATLALAGLALLGVPAVARLLPEDDPTPGRLDLRGAALVTVTGMALAGLLQLPGTDGTVLAGAAFAVVALAGGAALHRHVARRPDGFLPQRVLSSRRFLLLVLAAATLLGSYSGLLYAAPLLLEEGQGWSAVETGTALLPAALAASISANLAGTLGTRISPVALIVALCGAAAASLVLAGVGGASALPVCLGTVGAIAGFAASQVVMLDRIPEMVPEDVTGAALGVFNFLFVSGAAIGAAAVAGLSGPLGLEAAVAVLAVLPLAGIAAALASGASPPTSPSRGT